MDLYLDAFDVLGVSCTFSKFETADRSGFIRAFWREARKVPLDAVRPHDVQVIFLIVSMCLDFSVLDGRLLGLVLLRFLSIARIEKRPGLESYNANFLVNSNPTSSRDPIPICSNTTGFEFPQSVKLVRTFLFALFLDRACDLVVESVGLYQ